jgi:PEP-CTERM motif
MAASRAGHGESIMYIKYFAGAFIALMMTAGQALAHSVYIPHYPSDCHDGSGGCTTTPVDLINDNFNRSDSYSLNHNWHEHESHSSDIQIKNYSGNGVVKLGAQDPKTWWNPNPTTPNSSWITQTVDVPDCCVEGTTPTLTLSFTFVGFNTDNDDYLTVSWQEGTHSDKILANTFLDHYQLGDNSTTVSETFTLDFTQETLPDTISISFAVDIFGCGSSSCHTNDLEGIKLDNVKLVLDCPPVSQTPLPASLPLFVSGLGALGLVVRHRKRKAQGARKAS